MSVIDETYFKDSDFLRINETAFEACPSDSIDYAVMEKTADAVVVPMDAAWSDVGHGPPCGILVRRMTGEMPQLAM